MRLNNNTDSKYDSFDTSPCPSGKKVESAYGPNVAHQIVV